MHDYEFFVVVGIIATKCGDSRILTAVCPIYEMSDLFLRQTNPISSTWILLSPIVEEQALFWIFEDLLDY